MREKNVTKNVTMVLAGLILQQLGRVSFLLPNGLKSFHCAKSLSI